MNKASLVAPESQVMTGKKVTTILDSMWSVAKFGLTACHNGFGNTLGSCPTQEGNTDNADGRLYYTPNPSFTVDQMLDDISLMLTAGRLSDVNRGIVRAALEDEYVLGDRSKAI